MLRTAQLYIAHCTLRWSSCRAEAESKGQAACNSMTNAHLRGHMRWRHYARVTDAMTL
jgi:hypothetical protein